MTQEDGGSETDNQATRKGDSTADPIVSHVGVVSNSPPTLKNQGESNDERHHRLDRKRFFLECVTLGVLSVYAIITLFIYCANKKAADAAKSAAATATDTLKFYISSEGAFFDCRVETLHSQPLEKPWTVVTCINKGKTTAKFVTSTFTYKRVDSGKKIVQDITKSISRPSVVPSDALQPIFPVTIPETYPEWANEDFTVTATISYNNGVEQITQSRCWGLAGSTQLKSFRWVSCDDVDTAKKYPLR